MRLHWLRRLTASRGNAARKPVRTGIRRLRVEALEDRSMLATLAAAYSFSDGAGTRVTDVSGSGNSGTISGAVWSSAGKFGRALSFNGTNAFVNVPHSASLNLTTTMTLEAWVKPSKVTSAWRDVVYKGNDIYYLEATSPTSQRPAGGLSLGSAPTETFGTTALSRQYLDTSGIDVRWGKHAAVCKWETGIEQITYGSHSDLDEPAANGRR